MNPCPVCGTKEGRCGDTPLTLPPAGLREPTGEPMRLPRQVVRPGMRAGYKGAADGSVVVVERRR